MQPNGTAQDKPAITHSPSIIISWMRGNYARQRGGPSRELTGKGLEFYQGRISGSPRSRVVRGGQCGGGREGGWERQRFPGS